MTNRVKLLLACCALVLAGCGGGGGGSSPAESAQDDFAQGLAQVTSAAHAVTLAAPANNVVPIVVQANNRMLVSVKVCQQGTTTCQTVDGIMLDTGSVGLRIRASALQSVLGALGTGAATECGVFGNFYTWGALRVADAYLGGEVAHGLALQVYGDTAVAPASTVGCGGSLPDALPAQVGFNGILGVKPAAADNQSYYQCSATACTAFTASSAQQLPNPVVRLDSDNNGYVVEMPALAAGGAATAQGALVLGVNTASNNMLSNLGSTPTVLALDAANLGFKLSLDGQVYEAIIDSGTGTYALANTRAMPACSGSGAGLYCPASATDLAVMFKASAAPTVVVDTTFTVGNGTTLTAGGYGAFNDVASPIPAAVGGYGLGALVGAPFFYGRSVYFAIDGQPVAGRTGTSPFVAF